MIRKQRALIVWAAVIAALLGSAYVIVARNGGAAQNEAPSGYIH